MQTLNFLTIRNRMNRITFSIELTDRLYLDRSLNKLWSNLITISFLLFQNTNYIEYNSIHCKTDHNNLQLVSNEKKNVCTFGHQLVVTQANANSLDSDSFAL